MKTFLYLLFSMTYFIIALAGENTDIAFVISQVWLVGAFLSTGDMK